MQQQGLVADGALPSSESLSVEQWLTLNSLLGIGPATFEKFIRNNISLRQLAQGDISQLQSLNLRSEVLRSIQNPDKKQVDQDLNWLHGSKNRHIVPVSDPNYPVLLKQTSAAPLVLYCEGNLGLLTEPLMAIVGSRACSPYGQDNASKFAGALSDCGWGIVSGMAIGIDTFAHKGCIVAGGQTVAVLGTGLAQNYPKRNLQLRHDILSNNGCIISELATSKPPRSENFPRRNRIISGISWGTLVIEALLKSGSLITARYALEQNREVFALPGNIQSSLSKGCHRLIKNGAKLVESADDINEEFLFLLQSVARKPSTVTEKNSNQGLASDQLLASVDYEATCLDVVVQRSRLPISEVTAKLLEYELRGLVASVPGGYIRLGE